MYLIKWRKNIMIQHYSYAIDRLIYGKGFERNSVNWTWERMVDWMKPIPNINYLPGVEKWVYRILGKNDEIVFEGTQEEFNKKYS